MGWWIQLTLPILEIGESQGCCAEHHQSPKVQEHQTSWTSSTSKCFLPSPARRRPGRAWNKATDRTFLAVCGLEVKPSLFHIVFFYSFCSCTSILELLERKIYTKLVHLGNGTMVFWVSCRFFRWISMLSVQALIPWPSMLSIRWEAWWNPFGDLKTTHRNHLTYLYDAVNWGRYGKSIIYRVQGTWSTNNTCLFSSLQVGWLEGQFFNGFGLCRCRNCFFVLA